MATIHQQCSEIIEKVSLSGLDYSLNQTPYSIHFSIRKKFSKFFKRGNSHQTIQTENQCQNDYLRQELLNMCSEYGKLFSFYQAETEQKLHLESELNVERELKKNLEVKLDEAYQELNQKETAKSEAKRQNTELQSLKVKFENKCLEFKHLKDELDNVKKDKNALSVALKGSKQEVKEQSKAFSKERESFHRKNEKLVEFKTQKLNEEREEKMREKKEIKKAKKKLETINSHDKIANVSEETPGKDIDSDVIKDEEETPADENSNHEPVDVREAIAEKKPLREPVGVNEDDEGFIGPKLPRLMTRAECDAFREELFSRLFPR